jgi:hypothetical protein
MTKKNIDPVFVISGWGNPEDVPGFAPVLVPQISAPPTAPAAAPQLEHAEMRDYDDIIQF